MRVPVHAARLLASWPSDLASLPFGSPEFKAANRRLGVEDEQALRPVARAMPWWVCLTSTTVCNLKCIMCNQFLDPHSPKVIMADEVYERVVEQIYPFAQTMQLSTFGEPLMTPRMDQKLDDLERHGVRLEMVSNGTLMMKDSSFRERLLRNLGTITFSMDGAERATYNAIRQGGDYDEVVDNITRFCDIRSAQPPERRPALKFNFILMKRTLHEAPKFVEMCKAWGADLVTFLHLVTFHDSLRDESPNRHRAETNHWQDRIRETAAALGVTVTVPPNFTDTRSPTQSPGASTALLAAEPAAPAAAPRAAPPVAVAEPPGRMPAKCCWFLWQRIYIAPHGDVVPCCVAGMPSFGNLMHTPAAEVWNSPVYQQYRSRVFTPHPLGKCKSCYLIYPNAELAGGGFDY